MKQQEIKHRKEYMVKSNQRVKQTIFVFENNIIMRININKIKYEMRKLSIFFWNKNGDMKYNTTILDNKNQINSFKLNISMSCW